jgi:hypothetical protein
MKTWSLNLIPLSRSVESDKGQCLFADCKSLSPEIMATSEEDG